MKKMRNVFRFWIASALSALCLALCLTTSARAQTYINVDANFDDITTSDFGTVDDGYKGLGWYNFYTLNALNYYDFYAGPNGYTNAMVSGDYVAYNGYGEPAAIYSIDGSLFNLNSFYVNAAWRENLSFEVYGLDSGYNVAYYSSTTLDPYGPYLYDLGWTNLKEVFFVSSGGDYAGFNGDGQHFAIDNVSVTIITPEPSEYVTFGIFAFGMGAAMIRARRRR